jgi:hypothetical protein
MNNREFDELLKSKLTASGWTGNPDWIKMESLIDQWELEEGLITDEGFDKVISEKLEASTVEYDVDSWPRLENKLNHRQSIGRRIIYYQLSGAAVILLLLMLLFQLIPGQQRTLDADVVLETNLENSESEMKLQNSDVIAMKEDETNSNHAESKVGFENDLSRSNLSDQVEELVAVTGGQIHWNQHQSLKWKIELAVPWNLGQNPEILSYLKILRRLKILDQKDCWLI